MKNKDRINDMLNMETRMSKWKQPQPLDFVYGATSRYSFVMASPLIFLVQKE